MFLDKKTLSLAVAGVCALVAPALSAQLEIDPYLTVHYDEVDPAQSAAFEANSADWVAAFQAAGVAAEDGWEGYSSDFTYAWVNGLPNWAHMDSAETRQKAIGEAVGEETMADLMAAANGPVTNHHTEVLKFRPELSYIPAGFVPGGMAANVGTQYVKPGKEKDFEAAVKEALAALKKVDATIHFFGYSVAFGEGSYVFVSWAEDRAALHSGPQMGQLLGQALGAEAAQALYQRWADTLVKVTDRDWRVRPDLSYRPDRGMPPQPASE